MADLRAKSGFVHNSDGRAAPARFYYGEGEDEPPTRATLSPEDHATWVESDGAIGIRRGTSVSIGASRAYSANYDAQDWGN
jgi:hypothetical protein